jgi:hypothetical protein
VKLVSDIPQNKSDAKTGGNPWRERRFGVIITRLKSVNTEDFAHMEIAPNFAVGGKRTLKLQISLIWLEDGAIFSISLTYM